MYRRRILESSLECVLWNQQRKNAVNKNISDNCYNSYGATMLPEDQQIRPEILNR